MACCVSRLVAPPRAQPGRDAAVPLQRHHGTTQVPASAPPAAPRGLLRAVVHGRSADPADAASRDHHLTNYLSILPGPLHAGAAQLQVRVWWGTHERPPRVGAPLAAAPGAAPVWLLAALSLR